MELHDIVNENDEVIRVDTRENIIKGLKKGEYVRVVNILLFNSKNKLLVPKRAKNRRIFPSCYDFSCGEHVEKGENYKTAAIRGLKEELGLETLKIDELGKLGPNEGVSSFMKIYKVIYDGDFVHYDRKGIEKLNWFPLQKVLEMINKDNSKFKGDMKEVLNWYNKNEY